MFCLLIFQVIDENYLNRKKNYATVQVWTKALSSLPGASGHLHYSATSETTPALGHVTHTHTEGATVAVEV